MGALKLISSVTLLILVLNLIQNASCRRNRVKEYPIDPKYDIPNEEAPVDIKKMCHNALPKSVIKEIRSYKGVVKKLSEQLRGPLKHKAWNELADFVDTFGPRMSGTEALEKAIDYMHGKFESVGLTDIEELPSLVSDWVR